MFAPALRWLTPAALFAAAGAAAAQMPPSPPRKADPLDASAAIPAVAYESAFSRYRRSVDDRPISWRDANDTAARIGGWRAYAREAQQPEPAASAPAASPFQPGPQATPPGHRGHQMP